MKKNESIESKFIETLGQINSKEYRPEPKSWSYQSVYGTYWHYLHSAAEVACEQRKSE